MSASVTASDRDLRRLADIVSEDRPDLVAGEGLPPSLLADLMGQIRCDVISFEGFDSKRRETWLFQSIPGRGDAVIEDLEPAHWEHYWDCQPCSYRQWHSVGTYSDIYRPQGLEHDLMLTLPPPPGLVAGPGRTIRLFFFRGPGPDFSDRDRAVLTLLRPHLHQAYLDAERRRHPVPRLTSRQTDLLRLVAAGHTNTQIARRLGISEATVRTHLENIYSRLQVSSRTAAVTRAFQDLTAS